MEDKITMIELFSGIGAQERALRQIGIPYEVIATCDCDKDAILSYASMRSDFEDEFDAYNFPSVDEMIEELQSKNIGYDFMKGKHTITSRTSLDKVKQYYLADKLSKNLGDISNVEKLPYADIITYSFPCTDLSVAGKGEGMVIKCNKCGHSWPIDFSVSESDVICPNCGNTNIKSTRSGLLGEVQRLLSVSKKEDTLPKYLLLENVKNLVGKKFKSQFDAWIKWLDSIGYNTYYQVLNAKHYGIPQNRERIFAVSIRKDIDDGTFKFPNEIPLTTRLKDILEMNVDEKYYIDNDRTKAILNSDEFKEKFYNRNNNNVPVRLTNIYGEQFGTGYAGNIWDTNGLSPTLQTAQGGNRMPLIPEQINVIGNYMNSGHEASRVINPDGIAPTVKENHGTVNAIIEPFIVASRGRNPDNPSDRTAGVPTEQRLEPNLNGTTNTITTVQKDNYVCEPIVCEERRDEGIRFFKDDCCGTLRTIDACGDKRVLEPEPQLEFVGGLGNKDWAKDGKKLSRNYPQGSRVYSSNGIASALTAQGVGGVGGYSGLYTVEDDNVDTIKVRNQATEFAGYTDVAGTLMARDYKGFGNQEMTAIIEKYNGIKYRIRKLTPKECWRLMGFTDSDCDKATKYVSASALYKQAGNSICTCCLVAIFNALFLKDYSKLYETKLINYNNS